MTAEENTTSKTRTVQIANSRKRMPAAVQENTK